MIRSIKKQNQMHYLLGTASPIENEEIETLYFSNRKFHEELVATEKELMSAYLSGGLNSQDRKQFELSMQHSSLRRKKVEALLNLQKSIAQPPQAAPLIIKFPRFAPLHKKPQPLIDESMKIYTSS